MPAATWIVTDGGPPLVLPTRALKAWRGTRRVRAGPTDYERAASVRGSVESIAVKEHVGLVLGDEAFPTTWIPDRPGPAGVFVRVRYARSYASALRGLKGLDALGWERVTGLAFEVPDGGLTMFDSAWPG